MKKLRKSSLHLLLRSALQQGKPFNLNYHLHVLILSILLSSCAHPKKKEKKSESESHRHRSRRRHRDHHRHLRRRRKRTPPPIDPTTTFPCSNGGYVTILPKPRLPPPPARITWIWNSNNVEDVRNWVELPPKVTLCIFMKLETIDILLTVSQVCSAWRGLSREPILYRSIVVSGYERIFRGIYMIRFLKFIMEGVDRSCGRLQQFSCGNMSYFSSVIDFQKVIASSTSLTSLRLGSCNYIQMDEILEAIKDTPSLEELYLHTLNCPESIIHDIGVSCPRLKYLQIGVFRIEGVQASEFGKYMPYLHCLRLFANGFTDKCLQAILDGCSHLKYFYLKGFSNLEGDLLEKHWGRIISWKVLSIGNEFGKEYEFHLKVHDCIPLSTAGEDARVYGGLSLCKHPFNDYVDPYFL